MSFRWRPIILAIAVGGLGVVGALAVAWSFSAARVRTVVIAGLELQTRVARTPGARVQGLSGTPAHLSVPERSMFFIFPTQTEQHFWMKDMLYPLDVYWFAGDTLLGVSWNIPAPQPGEEPARMSSPAPADRVLEVPAGTPVQF